MTRQRGSLAMAVAGFLVAIVLVLGHVPGASAHETREVEGEFEFVVGFMDEPAYLNERNGLDLRISYLDSEAGESDDHEHNDDEYATGQQPVENAEATLRAVVQFAGESQELDLRGVWGQPGAYTADIIPTQSGAYSFQITGEIDGVEITETFQAGPDTFSEIEPRNEIEFPEATTTGIDGGDQATAFGIAGVVAGLLGLLAGGAAYFKVSNSGKPNPAQRRREQKQAAQQERDQD